MSTCALGRDINPALFPLPRQMPPSDIARYGTIVVRANKRPTHKEPLVLETAARSVLPAVMDWLASVGDIVSKSGTVVRDLVYVAKCSDGLAAGEKLIASRRWDRVNAELVEILGRLDPPGRRSSQGTCCRLDQHLRHRTDITGWAARCLQGPKVASGSRGRGRNRRH